MKILLSLFIIMLSLAANTAEIKKLPINDFQKVSELKLDDKKDLELIKSALRTLLDLEKTDPSRTGVAMLSDSYSKHTQLYHKAAKAIETKKNKKALKEILQVMKSLSENGNG